MCHLLLYEWTAHAMTQTMKFVALLRSIQSSLKTHCDIIIIVTYVRSPCPNNVNVAVTIDSAELLQFSSNATMKTIASW
jgi:hypothetical protein